MNTKLKIVLCYAREDRKILQGLEKHLAPLIHGDKIEIWSDCKIEAGEDWEDTLINNLEKADIILLLISSDFLDSKYCISKEMSLALERKEKKEVSIIPIILRHCDWKSYSQLKCLQVLPEAGKPVISRDWNFDEALANVTDGLRKIIKKSQERKILIDNILIKDSCQGTSVLPIKNSSKSNLLNYIIASGATVSLLAFFAFAYDFTKSCSIGQYKSNFASCSYYPKVKDAQSNISGIFKYGGSTSLVSLTQEIQDKIRNSGEKLSFVSVNIRRSQLIPWSGEAIQQLIDGQLDIAFSSRGLTPSEIKSYQKKGLKLEAIPIAKDGLAFFVNSSNQTINSLSLEQIVKIYTGEINKWDYFDISNKSIIKVFSPDPIDNKLTPEYFQYAVMEGKKFTTNIKTGDPTYNIQRVGKEKDGIGFASTSIVCKQKTIRILSISKDGGSFSPCNNRYKINEAAISNSTYPLTRELFVIIVRDGKNKEQAGLTFINRLLSEEGQQYVRSAGYVPIR
jgi:ABC-type phosphate transport system substrate-binding protein